MKYRKSKVLIVDDSEVVRHILSKALTPEGYTIYSAVDGEDGWRKIIELQPDIVLLDVEMPTRNGFDVLREVRDNFKAEEIAVIMVTTQSDGKGIARAFEEGAFDYIPKPATESEIKARVRNAIRAIHLLREQKHLRQQAEAANQSKSAFLANMSHEIRTPMTAILGYTEILELEARTHQMPELFLDSLDTIRRNGGHLMELINDILDLSKIEAGKLDVESIACSPQTIVEEVMELVQVRAEAKGLKLETDFKFPLPAQIHSDPTRIRQILINLIGNAIKFTEVGTIRLETKLLQAPYEEPQIQFTVVDQGIGMSEAQMTNLFRPFSQADSSTSRKYGGTGLGLTICKRLANILGGDISVQSELNQGSRFSATVRTGSLAEIELLHELLDTNVISATAAADNKTTSAEEEFPLRGKHVLLAEDGPDNQKLISFILKKAGAKVSVAENGEEAYQAAIQEMERGALFDVILMDMQMPILDGYSATRKVRDVGYTGPIISLTANAMEGDREKCLAVGCNNHITKPIDRRQLVAMISEISEISEPSELCLS